MVCYQGQCRNLGDPFGVVKMAKHEIKNAEFKTSGMLHKGVRLSHSSAETPVMGVERRGQQSSNHIQNVRPINTSGGQCRQRPGNGQPILSRWMRNSLKSQEAPPSVTHLLPPNRRRTSYRMDTNELDGTKTMVLDKTLGTENVKMSEFRVRILKSRVRENCTHGSEGVLLFSPYWVGE